MENRLINPFVFVAGAKALVTGLAVITLTSVIAWWSKTHFDGVIDAHLGSGGPWWLFLCEGLIDWLCATLVLYITGRILSTSAIRLVDVAGTMALARYPMFFAAIAGFLSPGEIKSVADLDATFFLVALLLLACGIWMIILMYHAFRISCNLKGTRLVAGFIIGLLVAEVLSKLLLYSLDKIIQPITS